jgi:hypothetical protein
MEKKLTVPILILVTLMLKYINGQALLGRGGGELCEIGCVVKEAIRLVDRTIVVPIGFTSFLYQ